MTPSNGKIFRVTGPLCEEFTGHRWIPLTKASDAELWCFFFICTRTNVWVNNPNAGFLRRHHAHYVVTLKTVRRLISSFCYFHAYKMCIWIYADIDPYLYVSIHISAVSIRSIHIRLYLSAEVRQRMEKWLRNLKRFRGWHFHLCSILRDKHQACVHTAAKTASSGLQQQQKIEAPNY